MLDIHIKIGAFVEVGSHRQVWGISGGWCSMEMREWYDIGLWKAIRRRWGAFKSKISFVMGNGRSVRF